MAGYTRQSTFTDGDVITAAHSNDEFNQVLAAFNNTTGHKHDGTAAEGPVIGLIGDPGVATPLNKVVIDNPNNQIEFSVDVSSSSVEQLVIKDGIIEPTTNNDIDLGSTSKKFKDGHFAGTLTVAGVAVGGGSSISTVLDEDDMASNSATALATQQSIKAYVDTQLTAEDLDFQADSGGALSIDLDSETLTFTGGTGIDTSGSGNAVTFAIDSTVATLTGSQALTNKTIDVDNNTISNIEVDNLKSGVLDTDLSSVAGTDTTLASAKAIKAYVDAQVQTEDTLVELNDTDISSEAAGHILIHDGSDSFDNKPISGDITLAASGAVTIANGAVETAMLNANVISGQTAITSGLDTTNDTVLLHDADAGALKKVSLANLSSGLGGITDVVADTTPQLGGDLDVNGNDIVSVSNGNITLTPNGSGVVRVDGSNGIDMESGAISIKNSGAESYVRFYCESSNAHYTQLQAAPHSAYSGNVTVVLPASADTLVGRATTDTLTNKSIDASQLTGTVANARLDAQLQDIAGLATTDSGFIVGDGSNFVLETGATVRTSLGLGTAAVTNTGTSAGNTVVLDGSARLPAVDGSQLTNLPSTGATAGFAVAMAIAL
mgnify:CR=1 FL=1